MTSCMYIVYVLVIQADLSAPYFMFVCLGQRVMMDVEDNSYEKEDAFQIGHLP